MVASNWVSLEGEIIGHKYRLGELISAGCQDAWFSTVPVEDGVPEHAVVNLIARKHQVAVRLEDLRHRNLQAVFASGTEAVADLDVFWYAVSADRGETLETILGDKGPLDPPSARDLSSDLIAALDYLHGRGLVFGGLKPSAIIHAEDGWALSGYSLLRREGSVDATETRLLMAASPHVPPDAYSGQVSPAWDVFSLGVTLNQALEGEVGRGERRRRPRPAPPPFDAIIRGCLDPDPHKRIKLRDVAGLLGLSVAGRPEIVKRTEARQPENRRVAPEPRSAEPPPTPEPVLAPPSIPETNSAPLHAESSRARRKSRVYAVQAPRRAEPAAPEREDNRRSRWESLSSRTRKLALATLGVAALAAGVLLAVYDAHEDKAAQRSRPSAVDNANRESVAASSAPPARNTAPPAGADPGERRAAIYALLEEWQTTARERDIERHVSTYAPEVDVFFTKRNVPLSAVRQEKQALFDGISEVRKLEIRDIRVESFQPERAVVSFRKDWDFRGEQAAAGAERERLTLRWIDGGWRIASEQELRVYWKRRR